MTLGLILTLAGCGFHPLYGSGSGKPGGDDPKALAELQQVRVDTIADRQGQELRNFLIDDIHGEGVPPPATHDLVISYTESQVDLGLSNNAVTTRGQLTISATFRLKDSQTGVVQTSGVAQEIRAYNILTSEFATILSRDAAESRALQSAADDIATRLAFYFENAKKEPAGDAGIKNQTMSTAGFPSGALTPGNQPSPPSQPFPTTPISPADTGAAPTTEPVITK